MYGLMSDSLFYVSACEFADERGEGPLEIDETVEQQRIAPSLNFFYQRFLKCVWIPMQCSEMGPAAISHFTIVIDWMHGLERTNEVKFQRSKFQSYAISLYKKIL